MLHSAQGKSVGDEGPRLCGGAGPPAWPEAGFQPGRH